MRIDFHSAATTELEDSADWYAARSVTAAGGFAQAIEAALDKIATCPDRFPKVDARHRSCSLIGYPFQVVFRNDGTRVYIIAIVHAKRRPGYWRNRT